MLIKIIVFFLTAMALIGMIGRAIFSKKRIYQKTNDKEYKNLPTLCGSCGRIISGQKCVCEQD